MAILKHVEYMCTYCGRRTTRAEGTGRPLPGKCPSRPGVKPHSWVVNRKY